MDKLFLILLFLVIYVYCGYPLVLWIAGAIKKRPVRAAAITPSVSIIIPAYNEQACIGKKIENCLALDYPKQKLQIIVGSDGSSDETNSIVLGYQSRGVVLSHHHERVGKSVVLARCVEAAQGEIILFSDADSSLESDSLKKIVRNFADPTVGCVEGVRRDLNEQGLMLDSLYWKYETMLKKRNSALHSLIGATGAIFAIRKHLYRPLSPQRGDDFEIPIGVLLQGYGAVLEPQAQAYHPWLTNTDEFGRIVRIVSWMMPSAFMLLGQAIQKRKWLLAFQLLSHKILRWFMPLFLIILFWVSLRLYGGIYSFIYWSQALFYSLAFVGYICEKNTIRLPTVLKVPYFFCLINCASLVGILKLVCGKRTMNWQKTARETQ